MARQRKKRKPYKFDSACKKRLLELVRDECRPAIAARKVGITRQTLWDHLQKDAAFRRELKEAELERLDSVEDALHAAALGGNVVAIQVILYNRRPKRWQDKRNLGTMHDFAERLKRLESSENVTASGSGTENTAPGAADGNPPTGTEGRPPGRDAAPGQG